MPMQRELYPANWDAIALSVKQEAGWICQQCGTPCRQPGEAVTVFANRLGRAVYKPQRYTLTVAHLNHLPEDCRLENLRAMCAPCHLRYDVQHHVASRRRNQERVTGQLRIGGV